MLWHGGGWKGTVCRRQRSATNAPRPGREVHHQHAPLRTLETFTVKVTFQQAVDCKRQHVCASREEGPFNPAPQGHVWWGSPPALLWPLAVLVGARHPLNGPSRTAFPSDVACTNAFSAAPPLSLHASHCLDWNNVLPRQDSYPPRPTHPPCASSRGDQELI